MPAEAETLPLNITTGYSLAGQPVYFEAGTEYRIE
jgi:hypothetical protein